MCFDHAGMAISGGCLGSGTLALALATTLIASIYAEVLGGRTLTPHAESVALAIVIITGTATRGTTLSRDGAHSISLRSSRDLAASTHRFNVLLTVDA